MAECRVRANVWSFLRVVQSLAGPSFDELEDGQLHFSIGRTRD